MASRMAERWYGAALQPPHARAPRPAAADPLRQRPPFPADQRDRGRARRRHGRRDGSLQAADRPAACRPPRSHRSRARPRVGSRVPVRHHRHQRQLRTQPARSRCRCGSSKAWPNTCRSGRSTRTPRCGCAKPRAARSCRTIKDLDNPKYFPYRYGQALWAFIGGQYGDRGGRALLRAGAGATAATRSVQERARRRRRRALDAVARGGIRCLSADRRDHQDAGAVRAAGDPQETAASELNVSPELSPDGSQRHVLLRAGPLLDRSVPRRRRDRQDHPEDHRHRHRPALREPAVPGSAGAWDRDGQALRVPWHQQRPAGAHDRRCRPTARTEREIRIKELDEILNPTWSPDGQRDRVFGSRRRAQRSVRLRSRGRARCAG